MKRMMRMIAVLALCCAAAHGYGQDAKIQLDSLNKLSDKAARVTDVTLDGSLLQFAVNLIEKADDSDEDVVQLKSIMKNLKGIYVKSFEFDEASQYSKADVESVRSQITARWTKIVQSIDKRTNEHDEIYLLKSGNGEHVAGVLILVAEPKELTVVNIVGDVPVEKISSLEHHFVLNDREAGKKQKKEKSHDED